MATKADGARPFLDFKLDAKWRSSRRTYPNLLAHLRESGHALIPLFSLPGFRADMITIDLLHTLDLGVTQDAIGNIFFAFW